MFEVPFGPWRLHPALAMKRQEGCVGCWMTAPLFLPKCSEEEANYSGTR